MEIEEYGVNVKFNKFRCGECLSSIKYSNYDIKEGYGEKNGYLYYGQKYIICPVCNTIRNIDDEIDAR